ncbi:RcnB family protein [Rhizobium helianthi]|uniref:RcnB family protein n=1 Tax=Rhizobium helianthi TaxID=1132695 RepID=A0ABW4LZ31_9HYPH
MKRFITLLTAATILAAPMAQAQDHRSKAHDRGRTVERTIIEKRTIVKKPRWHRGQKLSRAERARLREIRDYRRYRLSAPPRGYHWVRVENQFLLVGITSGVISSIIAGR